MIGINLSGAEFGSGMHYGYDYVYPSAGDINYYAQRGVEFIRLPVKWERLQLTPGAEINQTELGHLKDFLVNAEAAGIKVLVDLHNYGNYGSDKVGSDALPISTFADFWSKLATELKDSPALAGYDLMNEPVGFPDFETWPKAAQAAVDAIRKVDVTHDIYVEGDAWATAINWSERNPYLDIKDPANKIVYEAHVYFDRYSTGASFGTVAQEGANLDIGAQRIADFAAWLKEHNARGFIGEFAVPDSDPAWNTVLENFVKELDKQGISGTYWGAGPWWGDYPLSLTNANGTESAQMAIMKQYFGGDSTPPAGTALPISHDYVATAAAETFVGSNGDGSVSYVNSVEAVHVDLAQRVQHGGAAEGDTLTGIPNLTGSAFADELRGDALANALHGGAGNDHVLGGEGNDTIDGGDGDDVVGGDAGDDHILGGAGDDHLGGNGGYNLLEGGIGNDNYWLETGNDIVVERANEGWDIVNSYRSYTLPDNVEEIRLEGNDAVNGTGNALDNWIHGNSAANLLSGMNGNDELRGWGGDDTLLGGAGNDHIEGGDDNDNLTGGEGADILAGGSGADTFWYTNTWESTADALDHIADFDRTTDKIALQRIDANTNGIGDQAFAFIGTAGFTNVAGQLRYDVVNGAATVQGDVDGDGHADFAMILDHMTQVKASDFHL